MILQALKEYYDRKSEALPQYGFEQKAIPFVVALTPAGDVVALESTYEGTGKSRRAKSCLVPHSVKRAGTSIKPNLLWDVPGYALGAVLPGKKREQTAKQHAAFIARVNELETAGLVDEGLLAVRRFLERGNKVSLLEARGAVWADLVKESANLSFRLAGDACLVAERPAVQEAIRQAAGNGDGQAIICSVTGNRDALARTHPAIKGVRGAQPCGANIVSFNDVAFTSYGKERGENAPIGKRAAFAYTTALNQLLSRDSEQKLLVGDASMVFWASRPTPFESTACAFFRHPAPDDPDCNVQAVADLLQSVRTGAYEESDKETRFYVLGLAPNVARLSIRFWHAGTVPEMAAQFARHFEDLHIAHGPNEKDVLSLFKLLLSTAPQGKRTADNISPNLAGNIMQAILKGRPYPQMLLQAVICRIRAEHKITYSRAALLKAYINRATRFTNPKQKEELKVDLDETNTNIGYRLGRLFATLERIQTKARPGLNATIRDKFCGAASSTPATVFGRLLRLKNHHKLETTGLQIFFEKLLGQIMAGIEDFPAHLKLADQGRFFVGYYHQTQAFFTKKSEQTDQEREPDHE